MLDSAKKTNPDEYERSIRFFDMLKPYIHMESILDFINHKNITYSARNTEKGFTIHATLHIKESEMHDQQRVLYVTDQTFSDLSKHHTLALKRQTISLVELSISTESGISHPYTTLKVSSNISRSIQ